MEEIWKDIKDYEGYYQISNLGRVKSLSRTVKATCSSYRVMKDKILATRINSDGYVNVILSIYYVSKNFSVHRLVAKAFIPNPNNYPQVNHIDGDKRNNKIQNLEWTTISMNHKHAYRLGLQDKKGEKHHRAKLTNKKVLEIRKLYNNGNVTPKEIAERYHIRRDNVYKIIRLKAWKHI